MIQNTSLDITFLSSPFNTTDNQKSHDSSIKVQKGQRESNKDMIPTGRKRSISLRPPGDEVPLRM